MADGLYVPFNRQSLRPALRPALDPRPTRYTAAGAPGSEHLILEDGTGDLLLETGDFLILETGS